MASWLHVWDWAEEESRKLEETRAARLQAAIAHFGLDPAEVLGRREVEDELLERYAAVAPETSEAPKAPQASETPKE